MGCTECRKHQRLDCLTAPHQWPTRGRPAPRGSSSLLTDTGAQGSAGLHGENRTLSLTRPCRKSVTAKIGGLGTQCSSLRVSTRSKSRESFKDIVRGEMDEFLHESLKEELQCSKRDFDRPGSKPHLECALLQCLKYHRVYLGQRSYESQMVTSLYRWWPLPNKTALLGELSINPESNPLTMKHKQRATLRNEFTGHRICLSINQSTPGSSTPNITNLSTLLPLISWPRLCSSSMSLAHQLFPFPLPHFYPTPLDCCCLC